MDEKTDIYNTIVIGDGVSSLVTVMHLVKKIAIKELSSVQYKIAWIGKEEVLGPGLPYKTSTPLYFRINDSAYTLSTDTEIKNEFVQWIFDNPILGKDYGIEVTQQENALHINHRHPPRALFGKFCEAKREAIFELAKNNNIELKTFPSSAATTMQPFSERKGYTVTCQHVESQETIQISGENVVLATGHLLSNKFKHFNNIKGFFSSPWQDLTSIDMEENVIVVGSNLSGIDAAIFFLKKQNFTGKIFMVSNSGLLPVIKNSKRPNGKSLSQYELKYLTEDFMRQASFLTLETIITQFNQELMDCTQPVRKNFVQEYEKINKEGLEEFKKEYQAMVTDKEFKPEQFNQELMDCTQSVSNNFVQEYKKINKEGLEEFKKEYQAMVTNKEFKPEQLMLDELYFKIFPYLSTHLSSSDFDSFLLQCFPDLIKSVSGIPPCNAKLLKEAIDENKLELHGASKITAENSIFCVETKQGKNITAPYLIDATAPIGDVTQNPFLKNLSEQKLIEPFTLGGVKVDPTTHQVTVNQQPIPGLYAIGPVCAPWHPGTLSITATVNAAENISETIVNSAIIKSDEVDLSVISLPFFSGEGKEGNECPFKYTP